MKNIIIGILVIILLILIWIIFLPRTYGTSVKKNHQSFILSSSTDITCTYPQVLYTSYQGEEITHELSKSEKNPIIMTFSDIKTEVSKIKFIDATQTISEVSVVKVLDTADKLIFLEGSGDPYITVHTIYKDKGVSTYAKQVSFLGIPVGTLAMGTCISR